MGSSGSGGFLPQKPPSAQIDSLVKKAQEQAARDKGEAAANQELLDLLAAFNDRDVDSIRERIEAVGESLGSEVEVDAIVFGGSVAKHTYVDGLSDIDALVILEASGGAEAPADLKALFHDLLERKLPMGQVETIREGDLAVTVEYRDGMELQLLPAKRSGDQVAISDMTGRAWSHINPTAFTRALTEINQAQAGAVVPTVKLAKSMIANFPEDRRLTGYHAEALAVEVFQGYDGRKTPVAMLRHFFKAAADRVRSPMQDPTGQSATVDGYLGPSGSTKRKVVSDTLATMARALQSASSADRWRQLVTGE